MSRLDLLEVLLNASEGDTVEANRAFLRELLNEQRDFETRVVGVMAWESRRANEVVRGVYSRLNDTEIPDSVARTVSRLKLRPLLRFPIRNANALFEPAPTHKEGT